MSRLLWQAARAPRRLPSRLHWLCTFAWLLVAVVAPAQATTPPQAPGVTAASAAISRGVVVLPETVTVGAPFRVVVRIRAPRGATIDFPQAPDSGTGVEALDPVDVVPSADTTVNEQTATYRLAAWDVGARAIRLADVVVHDGDEERAVVVGRRLAVFVASVLPADSSDRVPKPPRALYEFGPPWWWWALVALAALGVVGVLWWLWRRRRVAAAIPRRSPREEAEEEFARIEALDLVASGERGQHAALMTDVLRNYIARVLPAAMPSLTTSELLLRLRGEGRVPLSRLARVLQDVDLVKFAGSSIDPERAHAAGAEARAIVTAVDVAIEQALQRLETREAA
ncbi:MAG: DUF4381 family protein [Gemmatimonadota bacterium]